MMKYKHKKQKNLIVISNKFHYYLYLKGIIIIIFLQNH